MPYELTLRPRSASPLCHDYLRQKLLAEGLMVHPESGGQHELLFDDHAHFTIIADQMVPAGVRVLVQLPHGRAFFDITLALLKLERLAGVIDADLLDDDELMVHSGPAGLASLIAFNSRYERASNNHGATHGKPQS